MTPDPNTSNAVCDAKRLWSRALRLSWPLGVATGLLSLAPLVFMFQVYGDVSQAQSEMNLWSMFALLAWVLMTTEAMNHWRAQLLRRAGESGVALLESAWLSGLGQLGWRQGATTPIWRDLNALRDGFGNPALLALFELPATLLFMVWVAWIHPALLAVTGAAVAAQGVMAWRGLRKERQAQDTVQRQTTTAEQWLAAIDRNRESVSAMNMLPALERAWSRDAGLESQREGLARSQQQSLSASQRALQWLAGSALLGLGAWLLMNDALGGDAALLIVASSLGGKILAPAATALGQSKALLQARMAYRRVLALMSATPATSAGLALPSPKGALSLRQVSAAPHEMANPVLRGIQFELSPGQTLAVLGASGSGKSALLRALCGTWPITSGEARLDGVDLTYWDRAQLGPFLGHVPQSPPTPTGTLWDLVSRKGQDPTLTPERLGARFPMAWFECVDRLPLGWHTPCDQAPLSRGEWQRLWLAAALAESVRLLILDQPETGLDDAACRALGGLLQQSRARGVTCVIVTQRKDWLQSADHWMLLERGRVRLSGPRTQVQQQLSKGRAS